MSGEQKIPKIIHYCWFGNGLMSEKEKACIESWKKYCPDYEIMEWNDQNYDIHKCLYMEQAAAARKWSFITDYVRLDVVYEYGGFYFDTDVEMLRDIEELRSNKAVIGFEEKERVNDGQGFGAIPHFLMIKEMLDMYQDLVFLNADLSYNLLECPHYRTRYLTDKGLKSNGKQQYVGEMLVLPTEYFCPKSYHTGRIKITKNTYSIHYFNASWQKETEREANVKMQKIKRLLGKHIGGSLLQCYFFYRRKIRRKE